VRRGYGIGGAHRRRRQRWPGRCAADEGAKQSRFPYDADRIWRAVTNSARHGVITAGTKQGNGVVDVAAALECEGLCEEAACDHDRESWSGANAYSGWLARPTRASVSELEAGVRVSAATARFRFTRMSPESDDFAVSCGTMTVHFLSHIG